MESAFREEQTCKDGGTELKKILLVEDDVEISDMLKKFLGTEGFEVVAAYAAVSYYLRRVISSSSGFSIHLSAKRDLLRQCIFFSCRLWGFLFTRR